MSEQLTLSERDEKCEDFLAQIDHIDDQIKVSQNKLQRRKLEREKSDLFRQFATYLDEKSSNQTYWNGNAGVSSGWLVAGVPSKYQKAEAEAWMRSRSLFWIAGAPQLRDEVARALLHSEPVPAGYFGLHVERTVKIDKRLRFDGADYSYDESRR
jgi:hypothetical protein